MCPIPGIKAVAHLAGVSTATVSRVLNDSPGVSNEKRQRVLTAQKQLGYVISSHASSLASGRTRNIGVVMPLINRWFFNATLDGIQRELLEHGYDLTLYSVNESLDDRKKVFEDHILRKRVDGVLAICIALTPSEVGELLTCGKPVVGIGGYSPGAPFITIDHVYAAFIATSHLVTLGHRNIGHIEGSSKYDINFHIPTQRQEGYEAALATAGLQPQPRLKRAADFSIPGGYAAAKDLLGSPTLRPTAIYADSDEMAIGALLAARDMGIRVPEQLSVVGVDNHNLSAFFGLTTAMQNPQDQGKQATNMLLDILDNPTDETNPEVPFNDCLLRPELIVRSSTAAPNV